ncbi:MAG: hypothetical protein ACRD5Z_12800 [Bryobacteraceae bacterium]
MSERQVPIGLALPPALSLGQELNQLKHLSMTGSQGWGVAIVSQNMRRRGPVFHFDGAVEIKTWSRPSNSHEGYMIVHADRADYHIDSGVIEPRGNVRLEPHDR